jgi:hypothetical protein
MLPFTSSVGHAAAQGGRGLDNFGKMNQLVMDYIRIRKGNKIF